MCSIIWRERKIQRGKKEPLKKHCCRAFWNFSQTPLMKVDFCPGNSGICWSAASRGLQYVLYSAKHLILFRRDWSQSDVSGCTPICSVVSPLRHCQVYQVGQLGQSDCNLSSLQPRSGFRSLVITAALEPLRKLSMRLNTQILILTVNAQM